MKKLTIHRDKYQYVPVLDRRPSQQSIRERAEFLAYEIFNDRLASCRTRSCVTWRRIGRDRIFAV